MEIVLKDICYRHKCKKVLDLINLKIKDNVITGITGDNKTLLAEIIDSLTPCSYGEVRIGKKVINEKNLLSIRQSVSLVKQNAINQFFTNTIEEEMFFLVERLKFKHKDLPKKIIKSLSLVGLDESYLKKEIKTLASGQQKLLQIALSLIYNPDTIIFDEPFLVLDYDNKKKIIKLIKLLKEKYNKTIIILSNDSNLLYELTEDLVIIKKGKVVASGKTEKLYQDVELLTKHKITVPHLVMFTYQAKRKKVKLNYHKDIRDLIKDVYKHV